MAIPRDSFGYVDLWQANSFKSRSASLKMIRSICMEETQLRINVHTMKCDFQGYSLGNKSFRNLQILSRARKAVAILMDVQGGGST